MRERTRRIVPQKAITVAMEGLRPGRSYGVIANISAGGACVLTDARIALGESLALELSFFREPQVVSAAGRVVWTSGTRESGALRYGLEWMPEAGEDRLRDLIDQAEE